MPLLLETVLFHVLAFGIGLLVGAGLWKKRGFK